MMGRLDEVGEPEAGGELAADLLGQRVAVLDRAVSVGAQPFGIREIECGEREPVARHEFAPLIQRRRVEDEDVRVHEPRQQHAARAQHAEGLPPYRREVGAEHVRHGVDDDVERGIGKDAQVTHIAKHRLDGQPLPGGHLLIPGELSWRVVEDGHGGAGGGQHRALLPAAGSQAEHCGARQVSGEPPTRCWLVTDEHHRPLARLRGSDDIMPNRPGPFAVVTHLAVPGGAVVRHRIKAPSHSNTA